MVAGYNRPTEGTWYHIVLNYMGLDSQDGGLQILIDGVEKAHGTDRHQQGDQCILGDGRVAFGKNHVDAGTPQVSADIDELYFFNNVLSENQTVALMGA